MNDLNAWFKDRPTWIQEAAAQLLIKGRLADEEIAALFDKCLQEVDSGDTGTALSFPVGAFRAQSASTLRLCSIGKVKGINALAPRSPLDFGPDNMAVIYGGNGSGKSGYVRILKHVCGARNPGALYPNVYSDDSGSQSAEIKYQLNDQEQLISWANGDGVQANLRPVDIFDADCGRMYLESESELTYEPPALLFFSDLISVCEQVARRIDGKLGKYGSKKPQLPAEYTDTIAGQLYAALRAETPSEEIATHTKWDSKDDNAVTDFEKRLAEKAPADRAKELLAKKRHVEDLVCGIEDHLSKLSDENCRRILKLKKDMLIKREAAQAAATIVFSGAPLEGIGTDAWKLLWEHARRYSEEHAYRDQAFPNIAPDARCVLCHQSLSEDARERLTLFEEFVKGQTEKEAKDAEKALEEAMADIRDTPTCQTLKTQ